MNKTNIAWQCERSKMTANLMQKTELIGECNDGQYRRELKEAPPLLPGTGVESAPWTLAMNPGQPGLGLKNLYQEAGADSQMQAGSGEGKGAGSEPPLYDAPTPPTHLAMLQEGKEPLQFGHQGL